ncbi:TIM44 subunit of mitochondria import inner membrane translocase [Coemansia reversa NRRL 1564]|uniref:Mitochondrial import inner membrane translocase subunit TIM44 n=1 Tax=Coemansia reversa (strain ATCC 12441 / NRRL 1564) TaxID=763665 RepID=A0A2G5BCL9_COERN|nr:TIM44 subunit of mitochondria import inner membrane translocase [Coemansia reversa NRRL 1564]|eukprot:PIA16758.1 TIM44 subunit of mitochondria import inner membrane translocase [Coemansia reversa NRRL 1564]
MLLSKALRGLHANTNAHVLLSLPQGVRHSAIANSVRVASIHTSQTRQNGGHISPLKAFADSVRRQVKENQELQNNMKLLEDHGSKFSDSEAMKKTKEAASAGSEAFRKTAKAVGGAVGSGFKAVSESPVTRATGTAAKATAKALGSAASTATAPIRNTDAYKAVEKGVKGYVDEASLQYGGYRDKEQRTRSRILSRANKARTFAEYQRTRAIKADENAGEGVVLHKDSKWKESWDNFKANNSVMQGIFQAQKSYNESENSVIEATRAVTDKVRGVFGFFFNETESASALRQIRDTIDPGFNLDEFVRECREFIIPEILDAYLHSDAETLKVWCSEASYNVLTAIFTAQIQQGVVSDCKILDMRHVEFHSARVLENDVPVIIITFQTHENNIFRNKKTGEIVMGSEDAIEACNYVSIFTKVPENADDPVTNGWKMIDLAKQASRSTW